MWLECKECNWTFQATGNQHEHCPRCLSNQVQSAYVRPPATVRTLDPPLFDHDGAAVEPVDEQLARAKGVRR